MTEAIENELKPELVKEGMHWYAVYTRPHFEKRVAEGLTTQGIENYLPLVKEKHRWADRRKTIEVPLIRGYVFVRIHLRQTMYVVETFGVVRIVTFNREYARIPDFQIDALKRALACGVELAPINYIPVGQMVQVIDGPLQGTIGRVQRIQNEDKFVISLDAIQASYTIQINPAYLRPISKKKRPAIFTLPLGM